MLAKGLKVGEPAPQITVQDLEGRSLTLGAARTDERATLLIFVSPTCPVCKALLPVLKSSLTSERDWLDIVLASDGDGAGQREFVSAHRLGSFPYVVSAAARHGLPGQPAAVRGADRRAGRAAGAGNRQFSRTSGEPVRSEATWTSHRSRIISKRRRNIGPHERPSPLNEESIHEMVGCVGGKFGARARTAHVAAQRASRASGPFCSAPARFRCFRWRAAPTPSPRARAPVQRAPIPATRRRASTGGTAPSTASCAAAAAARRSMCPPGTDMSPVTWIGTCHNPGDGKDYVISYNDCCGKSSCGRCFCNRNERRLHRCSSRAAPMTTTGAREIPRRIFPITARPRASWARPSSRSCGLARCTRRRGRCRGRAADAARGYQPAVNFQLNCMGCHLADGSGESGRVPSLRRSLVLFSGTPEGRRVRHQSARRRAIAALG